MRAQGQRAAARHRVARIHAEVQDDLFELADIDTHVREVGCDVEDQHDAPAEQATQHGPHFTYGDIEVDHLGVEHLVAAHRE